MSAATSRSSWERWAACSVSIWRSSSLVALLQSGDMAFSRHDNSFQAFRTTGDASQIIHALVRWRTRRHWKMRCKTFVFRLTQRRHISVRYIRGGRRSNPCYPSRGNRKPRSASSWPPSARNTPILTPPSTRSQASGLADQMLVQRLKKRKLAARRPHHAARADPPATGHYRLGSAVGGSAWSKGPFTPPSFPRKRESSIPEQWCSARTCPANVTGYWIPAFAGMTPWIWASTGEFQQNLAGPQRQASPAGLHGCQALRNVYYDRPSVRSS